MASDQNTDDFEEKTNKFFTWVQQQDDTTISPKIRISDLRAYGLNRGVGKLVSFVLCK